jgi:hypothetical protein
MGSFLHTFVRKRDGRNQLEASLLVLDSILESGLLLVPEEVSIPLVPGIAESECDRLVLRQLRLSLTMLDLNRGLSELRRHAAIFGPITIELRGDALRSAGMLPVFYFPSPPEGVPAASDLGFRILADLHAVGHLLAECDGHLPGKQADIARLLATLRGVASAFYPADTLQTKQGDEWRDVFASDLQYFRQHEWRLIGGLAWDGGEVCAPLTNVERDRLPRIDEDFFCNPTKGFDGKPKSDYCRIIRKLGTQDVRDCIVSVYATQEAQPHCKGALARYGLADKLQPI